MNGLLDNEKIIVTDLRAFHTGNTKPSPYHQNRLLHGFVIRCDGQKKYIFDDGTEYTHNKYDIIYLPKGSTYTVKNTGDGNATCYAINFDIIDDNTYPHFHITPKNGREIINLFKDTHTHWIQKKPGYYHRCMKDLYGIFAILKSEISKEYVPSSKEKLLSPAIEYIALHFCDETLTIPYLASICGISEVYFRKIFKTVYGTSPIKYINNLKIEKAEEMLISDMYSVSEISELLGYSSPTGFSKDFKKYTGISPGKYIVNKTGGVN